MSYGSRFSRMIGALMCSATNGYGLASSASPASLPGATDDLRLLTAPVLATAAFASSRVRPNDSCTASSRTQKGVLACDSDLRSSTGCSRSLRQWIGRLVHEKLGPSAMRLGRKCSTLLYACSSGTAPVMRGSMTRCWKGVVEACALSLSLGTAMFLTVSRMSERSSAVALSLKTMTSIACVVPLCSVYGERSVSTLTPFFHSTSQTSRTATLLTCGSSESRWWPSHDAGMPSVVVSVRPLASTATPILSTGAVPLLSISLSRLAIDHGTASPGSIVARSSGGCRPSPGALIEIGEAGTSSLGRPSTHHTPTRSPVRLRIRYGWYSTRVGALTRPRSSRTVFRSACQRAAVVIDVRSMP
eukprot:Unigene11033_Nuclearia_a/m.33735 Unigene11033_Nuclearia_a/g.33735  ORF Unigene11033_Nuclearia_a/g.33735 Unigene11033_Nuclearia_a/m.33735 type:complete len:359 (-) Unigene11033_Nuclearia_a:2329-3405(-)